MKIWTKMGAVIGLLALSYASLANDSTGWVSTGGIQYFKNPNIRMASEDLYISEEKIRVAYEFINDADHDLSETVLFPLPASNIQDYDSDFADIDALHQSFKVWVNGQAVQADKHLRAYWQVSEKKKQDITNALTQTCGLTEQQILQPYLSLGDEGEKRVTQNCIQKLVDDRVIPPTKDEYAMWTTQMVYSWQQVFPAHATLKVTHEYQPLVGGSVAGISRDGEYGNEMQRTYCFDKTFWQKMSAKRDVHYPTYLALGYILTTGANWAKPIERFHLTIEKPKGSLMSLCWDDSLKKVSDARFEAYKTHFTPNRDIDIIFAMPSNYTE